MDWVHSALCAEPEYEWVDFYPDETNYDDRLQPLRTPQEICLRCPVKVECATFAITSNQKYGIWGATNPRTRQILVKSNQQNRRSADLNLLGAILKHFHFLEKLYQVDFIPARRGKSGVRQGTNKSRQ